jgi:hypothetical protein
MKPIDELRLRLPPASNLRNWFLPSLAFLIATTFGLLMWYAHREFFGRSEELSRTLLRWLPPLLAVVRGLFVAGCVYLVQQLAARRRELLQANNELERTNEQLKQEADRPYGRSDALSFCLPPTRIPCGFSIVKRWR